MSLFERIKHRLNEAPVGKDGTILPNPSDSDKDKKITKKNIKQYPKKETTYQQQDLFDTSKTGKEDPVKDVKTTKDIIGDRKKKGRPFGSKNRKKDTSKVQTNLNLNKTDQKTIDQNRKAFRDLKRSKESGISQLNIDPKFNRKTGEYDAKRMREIEGDPQSKTIQQTIEKETGTKTREYTQRDRNVTKGNETVTQTKTRTPRKGVDFFADPPEVVKARRQNLIQKRKEYEIDRKGNITDKGVEKYARRIKQSNLPLTQKDLDRARKFAVGGEKIKNKAGEVIGTTTGKYGGRLAGTRKPKVKTQTSRQIVVNPNKTQQNREIQKLFRQTNKNRTVSDVRKNLGLSNYEKGKLDKTLEKLKKNIKVNKPSTSGIFDFSGELKRRQAQQKIKFDKFMTKIKGFKTPKVKPIKTKPTKIGAISKILSKSKNPYAQALAGAATVAGSAIALNQITKRLNKSKTPKAILPPPTPKKRDFIPVRAKLYLGSGNKGGLYKNQSNVKLDIPANKTT